MATDPHMRPLRQVAGQAEVNEAQNDFLQQLDGDMTAQQAAQLLELGMGETTQVENIEQPDLDPVVATTAAVPAPTEAELTAENAVVMAKDGKHVIDFQKLVDAREGEKTERQEKEQWRATAEQAQQELEALKAEAQRREAAGIAPSGAEEAALAVASVQAGGDAGILGDFSEEEIIGGVQLLIDRNAAALEAKFDDRLAKALAPMHQQTAQTSATARHNAHLQAIAEAHPDFESLAESKELSDWIDSQPGIARDGYRAALERGTTGQYIELFSTFKAATGKSQPAPAALSAREAAQAAIAKNQPQAPLSLSDIPGGKAVAGSQDEAMAAMNSVDLLGAMSNWSPKQIEEYMSRNL